MSWNLDNCKSRVVLGGSSEDSVSIYQLCRCHYLCSMSGVKEPTSRFTIAAGLSCFIGPCSNYLFRRARLAYDAGSTFPQDPS